MRLEETFFYALFVLFFLLSSLHLLTGYADNGDFARSIGFIFEKPDGFSEMWPSKEGDEWKNRFFNSWTDKWIFLSGWPDFSKIYSISTYKIYISAQALLVKFLNINDFYYSIISASLISRIILWGAIFFIVQKIRENFSLSASWAAMLIFSLLLLDSGWIAFLNSFYEDQVAIIFLPVLGCLIWNFCEKRSLKSGLWVLLCATFIGSAKNAYFYLPLLVSFMIIPSIKCKKEKILLMAMALIFQSISFAPAYFGKYGKINAYHSMYYGFLNTLTKDEIGSITSENGKTILIDCIGVHAFEKMGEKCVQLSDLSYNDAFSFVINHPKVAIRALRLAFDNGRDSQIDYVSKKIIGAPYFYDLPIFNVWPMIFNLGINYLISIVALIFILFSFLGIYLGINSEGALLTVGRFFAIFGLSQYFVVLGDGLFEIKKHLMIGNYSISLSCAFLLIWTIQRQYLFSRMDAHK